MSNKSEFCQASQTAWSLLSTMWDLLNAYYLHVSSVVIEATGMFLRMQVSVASWLGQHIL